MDFLHVIVAALFRYASRRSEIIFREATLRTSATRTFGKITSIRSSVFQKFTASRSLGKITPLRISVFTTCNFLH